MKRLVLTLAAKMSAAPNADKDVRAPKNNFGTQCSFCVLCVFVAINKILSVYSVPSVPIEQFGF